MPPRDEIKKIFRENDRFLISTHISPDGDGIGSALALSRGLRSAGKEARIVNHSDTPGNLRFLLRGGDEITLVGGLEKGFAPETYFSVVVDMGCFERLGSSLPLIRKSRGVLIVDHHVVEETDGAELLIDNSASATGEVVFDLLNGLGIGMSREIAEALYVAIETDTGGFRFSGTTPKTHLVISKLLEYGVEPESIHAELYEKEAPIRLKVTGNVLSTLWVSPGGKVASMELRQEMIAKLGARTEDGDDLVNHLMTLDGVKAGFYFKELDEHRTKVSCRSKDDFMLDKFLAQWGGGGHAHAAGLLIKENIESARSIIISKAIEILEQS